MTEPAVKKRKVLPKLDDSFNEPARATDSPELHQGRRRTVAHQQGQWAAHVFVELEVDQELVNTLERSIEQTKRQVESLSTTTTTIHSNIATLQIDKDYDIATLHLSLSRPLFLQTNQRNEFKANLTRVAHEAQHITCRFAKFDALENDEKSCRFLVLEIGPGYSELKNLVKRIDDELQRMRLPTYYQEPRFHCSIASSTTTTKTIAKLDNTTKDCNRKDDTRPPKELSRADERDSSVDNLPFDDEALRTLNDEFGQALRRDDLHVSHLCIKIGKVVTRHRLSL
ncbi:poly(U)-specific 3'-to-5' RNA exonuclease [Microbotryomycetes sp. JL221]|nr:poly(U)-specific 3'-to-5' RNA exonuclease [Microbotryomycetes sp. JL221]